MTVRLPLVLGADGLSQQLQVGDSLGITLTPQTVRPVTNAEASAAIVIGCPVYASASGDTVKRAQANAKTTSQLVGLGYDVTTAAAGVGNIISAGILVATTIQWDAVAGTTGGLVFGTRYFLDPATVGKMTATPPATTGQCNVLIGIALSTTELELQIASPILL